MQVLNTPDTHNAVQSPATAGDLWDALALWMHDLHAEGRASGTIQLYALALRRYATWMQEHRKHASPADVSRDDAEAYRATLLEAGGSLSSVNRAITSLRLFFAATTSAGLHNPFYDITLLPRHSSASNPREANGSISRYGRAAALSIRTAVHRY